MAISNLWEIAKNIYKNKHRRATLKMNFLENKPAKILPLLVSILFFGALWQLDFPKPFIDDLGYCGAGLNLAAGADFSNPLGERQHFPSHYFFVYPPIHSYAIAGWMKIFGIGARSLTGFQNMMYLLTALATIAILRRHKAPGWLEFLAPLGVSAAFLPIGLRPEPLSVALTMMGFAIIECGYSRSVPVFFAFLLMFLGGTTAPRLTLFTGTLVLLAGFHLWQNSPAPGWKRWSFCLSGLGALLIAGFIFFLFIGFRPGEFWQTFHINMHAHLTEGTKFQLLKKYFCGFLGKTQLPLFFLPPMLLLIGLRQSKDELFYCGTFIAVAFFLTALIGGIGHGSTWYAVLMMFCLAAFISRNASRHKGIMPVVLSLVLLLANVKSLMNVAGILSGEIQNDRGGQFAEAVKLRSTPEHPVLVDEAVARYVFDYRIPRGFIDFPFSAPFPGEGVKDFFQRQDVYVVSSENIGYLKEYTRLDFPPLPKWSLLGLARWSLNWSFDKHPCSVFVIPAETCRSLRSDTSLP
jgi:hypothetical protein